MDCITIKIRLLTSFCNALVIFYSDSQRDWSDSILVREDLLEVFVVNDDSWRLKAAWLILEVGQEREPKESAHPDVDCSQTGRYKFEVEGGEECPDEDSSLKV